MILAFIQAVLAISYPLIIWFGLARFEPRVLALFVLAFAGLRFALGRRASGRRPSATALRAFGVPALLIGGIVGMVVIWNDAIGLLMMPVAISLAFLLTFGLSLRSGPPMVERFARLQVEDLSTEEIAYCRRVTWIWCGFFVLNALIAGGLAAVRALDAWVLYTGLISYLFMGLLFAGEYLYRHWRFRRYVGAFSDPLLMRVFPPRDENEDEDEGESTDVAGEPRDPRPIGPGSGDSLAVIRAVAPDLRERGDDGDLHWAVWGVPDELACWPGHFPEQSLLPGVMQLGWVMRELEEWQGAPLQLRRVERLKFKLPVSPGDTLRAEMRRKSAEEGGERFRVELFLRDESAASLQVIAEPETAVGASDTNSGSDEFTGEAWTSLARGGSWPVPSAILPHAGDMLWLEEVIGHDETETAARVRTSGLGVFRDGASEDGGDGAGGAGAWHALEWMAQTVAAHDGVRRHAAGLPIRPGMLLGTKRLEVFGGALAAESEFDVQVRHVFGGDSGMVSYDCEVREADAPARVRARARLACRVGTAGAPLV